MIRIFIISSHPVFGHGLESLLRQETKLEIVGQAADVAQALEQFKALPADIVILDSEGLSQEATGEIMQLLTADTAMKVISMSLQSNLIYVYQASQWVATSVADLLAAIEYNLDLSDQGQTDAVER